MASDALLLVVIVRESGLRSALVARLAMSGIDMITATDFDDPRLSRHKHRPLVLIADERAVHGRPGGAAELAGDTRWQRMVLLSPGKPAESGNPRLICVQRGAAARTIIALLPEWRAADAHAGASNRTSP